jgi:hypothetical protein
LVKRRDELIGHLLRHEGIPQTIIKKERERITGEGSDQRSTTSVPLNGIMPLLLETVFKYTFTALNLLYVRIFHGYKHTENYNYGF